MIGWCNGEWAPLPDGAEVSVVHSGPSLFETVALRNHRIACLPDHLARLQLALPRLGLASERFILAGAAVPAAWSGPLQGLLERHKLTDAIIRLMVVVKLLFKIHSQIHRGNLFCTPLLRALGDRANARRSGVHVRARNRGDGTLVRSELCATRRGADL